MKFHLNPTQHAVNRNQTLDYVLVVFFLGKNFVFKSTWPYCYKLSQHSTQFLIKIYDGVSSNQALQHPPNSKSFCTTVKFRHFYYIIRSPNELRCCNGLLELARREKRARYIKTKWKRDRLITKRSSIYSSHIGPMPHFLIELSS